MKTPHQTDTRINLALAVFFLMLTVGMTWPMAIAPGAVYSSRQDFYLGLWDLWWVAQALTDGSSSLFSTTHLYYPFGTSLTVQPLTLLQTVAAVPLTLTAGPVVAYNTLVLFSFWLAGWVTALWVRALGGTVVAGLVAGVIFTFSPFHYTYIPQLNLIPIGLLPLYLLASLHLSRRPTRCRAAGAGLALAAVALASWYYAVAAGLVAAALSLHRLQRAKSSRRGECLRALKLEAIHWGVCALVVAPIVLRLVSSFTGDSSIESPTRPGLELTMSSFNGTGATFGLWSWAGITALLLAVVGGWRWRRTYPLLALAAGGFFLALGETVSLGAFELTMPYRLLESLPVLNALRYPARFFILTHLALAGLAGLGAARLARWGTERLSNRLLRVAGVACLVALPLIETWPGRLPSAPLPERVMIPSSAQSSSVEEAHGAVFHLPTRFRNFDGELMFHQLGHQRPISGGYLTRPDPSLIRRMRQDPYLGALSREAPSSLPGDLAHGLKRYGFAYVCVQKRPALPGYQRTPFEVFGPFSRSAGRYLRQRLFPAYEHQRALRPAVAESWISALEESLGPPISNTQLAAVFRVPLSP